MLHQLRPGNLAPFRSTKHTACSPRASPAAHLGTVRGHRQGLKYRLDKQPQTCWHSMHGCWVGMPGWSMRMRTTRGTGSQKAYQGLLHAPLELTVTGPTPGM